MSKIIDITGEEFGYWRVLERNASSSDGKATWRCLCQACGKIKEKVYSCHLRGGKSTNCGCVRMEKMRKAAIKDRTGDTYGFLFVTHEVPREERPRQDRMGAYWYCSCLNCGRENVPVFGDYLQNGDTSSCGCINSKNESLICKMLDDELIKYQRQYKFDELNLTGRPCDRLSFDIGVLNNQKKLLYLIKYDGIQHFQEGHFHEGVFEKTRASDLEKNKYCFDSSIPIIRIPYKVDYSIEDLKLETTRYLLTQENEKEYFEK